MFCPACGTNVPQTARFCSNCGTRLQAPPSAGGTGAGGLPGRPPSEGRPLSGRGRSGGDVVSIRGRGAGVTSGRKPGGKLAPLSSSGEGRAVVSHADMGEATVATLHGLDRPVSQKGLEIRSQMAQLADDYFGDENPTIPRSSRLEGQEGRFSKDLQQIVRPLARRWYSDEGPLSPEGRIFDASDRNILCMDVSPSGSECVVGSADHGLKVFDVATCKQRRNLYSKRYGHTEWVTTCCYLPDGRILSGGMDSKLCLWSSSLVKCDDLLGHKASISKVEANSQGVAISASYDRNLLVWDCAGVGNCIQTLSGHRQPVMDFVWYLNRVVSGDRAGGIKVWDVAAGTAVAELAGCRGQVSGLAFHHDAAHVVVGGAQDGYLRIWDTRAGGAPQHSIHLHPGGAVTNIRSTFFSQQQAAGNLIVTAGADRALNVVDPRNSFSVLHHITDHKDFVYSLHLNEDLILSGSGNGWLLVHDIKTGRCKYGLGANQAAVRCIHATNSTLIAAGDDGKAIVFDFGA
eukprot:TRINITY_DN68800_c0_g1_i1.p1 TRINITY_DN68800_c0_g1~~TRINITY_DN68800_c0_g1_i1.p1  ORF type:complete len:516 (-),score=31.20 TRINITY_DN68800_c0_g1_i1:32-1579(-)